MMRIISILFLEHLLYLAKLCLKDAAELLALTFRGQIGVVCDVSRSFFEAAAYFVQLSDDLVLCAFIHNPVYACLYPVSPG
jgi:hypothetical protein